MVRDVSEVTGFPEILDGRVPLDQLADRVLARNTDVAPRSGRQEYLENLVNRFAG